MSAQVRKIGFLTSRPKYDILRTGAPGKNREHGVKNTRGARWCYIRETFQKHLSETPRYEYAHNVQL